MLINTVGQLKKALSHYDDKTKVGIEDADEGSFLEITELFIKPDQHLLLIGGDYNHRIKTIRQLTEITEERIIRDNTTTEIAGSEE